MLHLALVLVLGIGIGVGQYYGWLAWYRSNPTSSCYYFGEQLVYSMFKYQKLGCVHQNVTMLLCNET